MSLTISPDISGVVSGSSNPGTINYSGTISVAGTFDGGTTTPTGTIRLNYGGHFYPTTLNLLGTTDTAITATHYFVETGSSGWVQPKTLANVTAEIVTTAAVNTAAATTVGTITTGTWNATNIAVANGGTGRSTNTTAYGLIAAGTTTTDAHQTLDAGLTTQILVGGGVSALPVWTTVTGTGAPVLATSPTLVTPALGTPSSGIVTNLTGTASININGTVGGTTPSTGRFTTVATSQGGFFAGSSTPGSGASIEVKHDGTTGYILCYDRTGAAYNNLTVGAAVTTFLANGVDKFRIDASGNIRTPGVYANTTASASNTFVDTDGTLKRSTSSIKYKTDVETLNSSYADSIYKMRPVWYRSLCEGDNAGWSWYGLIAEEVAEIDPRLVHWGYPMKTVIDQPEIDTQETTVKQVPDTDAAPIVEGMQYERLTVLLIDIVKRQKQSIESLEARLTALESL